MSGCVARDALSCCTPRTEQWHDELGLADRASDRKCNLIPGNGGCLPAFGCELHLSGVHGEMHQAQRDNLQQLLREAYSAADCEGSLHPGPRGFFLKRKSLSDATDAGWAARLSME